MRPYRLLALLLLVLAALLSGCQQTTPSPTATLAPPTPTQPSPLPTSTPSPSPSLLPTATPTHPSAVATATIPWTQGGPWPLPKQPLTLHVQAPAQVSESLWRTAIAAGTWASEIWLGKQASIWRGPNFPPQAHILFTARRPSPSGYLVSVYFTISPANLNALGQAFAQAGWRPLHNINPALAQMSPGLVMLGFHYGERPDEEPLNLFLLHPQGEKEVWGWASLGPYSDAPLVLQPPPLPWHLSLPSGWRAGGLLTQAKATNGQRVGSAWLVDLPPAGAQPTKAFAQWKRQLHAQGWQEQAENINDALAWATWSKGDHLRTLALMPVPWRQSSAVVLAYDAALEAHAPSSPQWHGTLSTADGRLAALLALVSEDPQFTSPLTLTLGSLPPDTWPLASQAKLAFGRQSGNSAKAWIASGSTAKAIVQALSQNGWKWQTMDSHIVAPPLFGPIWPEATEFDGLPVLSGALCKGEDGYIARLAPDGLLALVRTPTICASSDEDVARQWQGLLPAPPDYPFAAYAAMEGSYVGYNTGNILSLATFWLSLPAEEGKTWLTKATQALQAHQWSVKQIAPNAVLARSNTGKLQALIFALPAQDGRVLFGALANR